jgi:environmental stress-induced protein Ves
MTRDTPAATLIRREDLAISPWRNGAGRKADIASGPGWLVGYAFLDGDAAFSDYAGYDRTITLVEGPGFSLEGADGVSLAVDVVNRPTRFDGGWRTGCRVHGGACVVLNAMSERARYRHRVTIQSAAALSLADMAGMTVLVVLTGALSIGGQSAGARDAWRIDTAVAVEAAADTMLAVIRIMPA